MQVLYLCGILMVMAALMALISHRYSGIIGMVAGGLYIVYRLTTLIPRGFRGDTAPRLAVLVLMIIALLYGMLRIRLELFALLLLMGIDYLLLYHTLHR